MLLQLEAMPAGTRLSHIEHYVLLRYAKEGTDDVAHLKGATQLQMNALAAALGDLDGAT